MPLSSSVSSVFASASVPGPSYSATPAIADGSADSGDVGVVGARPTVDRSGSGSSLPTTEPGESLRSRSASDSGIVTTSPRLAVRYVSFLPGSSYQAAESYAILTSATAAS